MSDCGIYIHIPFCAGKCPYCDFYSRPFTPALGDRYVDALLHQLDSFNRRAAATVYFGGGTPSLLKAADGARVLDAVARRMNLAPDAEITLELNPENASPQYLKDLRSIGINRLSVGVQSTDNTVLQAIGRRHTATQALDTIQAAHDAGFDNISADIMIGLPGDKTETLEKTLADLTALPLTHLSAYMLKLMPDTPFGRHAPANIPDDDSQAALYEFCVDYLNDRGFAQYEISNFAKPGFLSRHNMLYWNCDDYIGLGPAAHSSLDGRRYSFPPDLDRYLNIYQSSPPPQQALRFEGPVTAADYIMLRLRTTDGLSLSTLYNLYNHVFDQQRLGFLARCQENGLLDFDGETVRLSIKGMLLSNAILAELI